MPRDRLYTSNADRQAAYRARLAEQRTLAGTDAVVARLRSLDAALADAERRTEAAETRAATAEQRRQTSAAELTSPCLTVTHRGAVSAWNYPPTP